MEAAELDKAVGELAQAQSSVEFEKVVGNYPELLNESVIRRIFALSEEITLSAGSNQLFKVATWLMELKNAPRMTLSAATADWEAVKPLIRESTVGWARAARQYLIRRDEEFIQKAISEAWENDETEIADFLQFVADENEEEVFLNSANLVRRLQSAGRDEESLTADLISLDFYSARIETFANYQADEQTLVFNDGMQACREAVRVSRFLNDAACEAFYLSVLASGFFSVRQIEPAIDYYVKAARKYRRLADEEPAEIESKLALILNNLAIALAESKRFGEALDAFSQALEIRGKLATRNPAEYERDLAVTLCNMGEVQRVAKQYEPAINSLAAALVILRRLAAASADEPGNYEPEIAAVLNNLGNAQFELSEFEQADASLREALEIRRRLAEQYPADFASEVPATFNNLAFIQSSRENYEGAINLLRQALEAYYKLAAQNPERHQPEIARTINNLGETQREANQFDEAIDSFRKALEVRQKLAEIYPQTYEPDVAATLNSLGNALYESGQLEEAIDSFSRALVIRRKLAEAEPQIYAPELAVTLNGLGVARRELRQFAQATDSLGESLEIRRKLAGKYPEVYELGLATTLNSLGNVYSQSRNTEQAIDAFSESFEIMRRLSKKNPQVYESNFARVANSLGTAQFDSGQYAAALDNYYLALEITQRLAKELWLVYEPDAALTLNNIANALRKSGRFEEAVSALSQALDKYRQLAEVQAEIYEPYIALTLNNLGETQRVAGQFRSAIHSFNQALELTRKISEANPLAEQIYEPRYAGLLNNLGSVQYEAGDVEQAVALYAESLRVREKLAAEQPQTYELDMAGTLSNLGILYAGQRNWETALEYFEKGRAIVENAREELLDISRRKQLFQEYANIYGGLLECFFRVGKPRKALEIAERGKSRSLTDLLSLKTVRPKFSLEETPTVEQLTALENLADAYENALLQAQQIESSLSALYQDRATLPKLSVINSAPEAEAIWEKSARIENEITEQEKQKTRTIARRNELLQEIRRYDKDFPPKAELLTEEQIFAISRQSNRVIVHFRVDEKETFVFVVFPDGDFNSHSISTFTFATLNEFARRWFAPYYEYLSGDKDLISTRRQLNRFVNEMKSLMAELYAVLLQPVREILDLKKYREVLFLPNGALTVLPLHAGCWEDEDGTIRYLLDEYTISYATSVSVFKKAWENSERCLRQDKFLFVTNPERDLESADVEVDGIIESFRLTPEAFRDFRHDDAVKEVIKAEMNNIYGFYHFSCHGSYDWFDPFSSPLALSDGRIILKEVMETDASSVWLTTLSACETGLIDFNETTDEHYGFPLAFIFAGSPSVWATIWSVDAASSADLMRRAYSHLKAGKSKAGALRQAQIDYRNENHHAAYSSPFFWAGFQHYGV